MWRVIEGQVPNLDSTPINTTHSGRRWPLCIVPNVLQRSSSIQQPSPKHQEPKRMGRDNLQRSIRQVPLNFAWPASTSQSDPTRSLWHKLCSRLGQPAATHNVTAAEYHWPQGHSSHNGLLMSSGIYTKSTKSKKTCLPKRPEMDTPSLVNVCVRIRPDTPCWSQPKVWLYNKQSAL